MNQKIALPLITLLLVSSVAVPLALYGGDDAAHSTGEEAALAGSQTDTAKVGDSTTQGPHGEESTARSTVSPVAQLLAQARPHSDLDGEIASRLSPLVDQAPVDVEPLSVPSDISLAQATLLHPAASDHDRAYVASLGPLPADLDQALGRIVAAHGQTTFLMASGQVPHASLVSSLTMATVLDQEMATLETYTDHPVWDQIEQASTQPAASPAFTLETPGLEVALLELYASLGFPQSTVDELAPAAADASDELPQPVSDQLAILVAALANYQSAVADTYIAMASPQSHSDGDGGLSDVHEAGTQVRQAADQVRQTLVQTPPGELATSQGPWTDPLGLIVVGTPGDDTFDASLGGDPAARQSVEAVGNLTRQLLAPVDQTVNASLSQAGVPTVGGDGAPTYAAAKAGLSDAAEELPPPGWHMLVLDLGGDDVYHNNAGGIDAGGVAIQADAQAANIEGSVETLILDEDKRLCLPPVLQIVCEPPATSGLLGLGNLVDILIGVEQVSADQSLTTGVPLAAMVLDLQGDDTYLDTGEVIQGAARGLAMGLLVDVEGDDAYMGGQAAQGAAEAYGQAALIDLAGDDLYTAQTRAQGWVDQPFDTGAETETTTVSFFSQEPRYFLLQSSYGHLADLGGHDRYQLDNLTAGQGVTQVDLDAIHTFTSILAPTSSNRQGALLLDVGGPEHLPVPNATYVVDNDDGERLEEAQEPPSQASLSGYEAAEYWFTRPLTPFSFDEFVEDGFFEDARYKTAIHVSDRGIPDPASGDAVTVGKVNLTWYETSSITGTFVNLFANSETPPLLLFGQPDHVEDPPALTLTFGGDTTYNGSIAASDGGQLAFGADRRSRGPGPFSFGGSGAFAVVTPPTPRVLLDMGGDDRYIGENETIGYASGFEAALLIDREGQDILQANDRSVAYATGNAALAAVLDLDGRARITSGEESQAFSTFFVNGVGSQPPMALLDLGSQEHLDGEGAWLTAGNRSQAYAEGRGISLLFGSAGDDRYLTGGWGQGFHDGQTYMARQCGSTPTGTIADSVLKETTVWRGGYAAMIDTGGNDIYQLSSQVGMGDTRTDLSHCSGGYEGDTNVAMVGLGTLVDLRGQDNYHLAEVPERPAQLRERACSGDRDAKCSPQDDMAWATDGNSTNHKLAVYTEFPGPFGIGVDNVRNLHHAAVAICRAYETIYKDGLADPTLAACDTYTQSAGATVQQGLDQPVPPQLELIARLLHEPLDPQRDIRVEVREPAPGQQGQESPDDAYLPALLQDLSTLPRDTARAATGTNAVPTLFVNDSVVATCQSTSGDARQLSPRGTGRDTTCLAVDSNLGLGMWAGNDAKQDASDPGDTVACNCSARVELSPAQGKTIDLGLELDGTELYPDRGQATTFTTFVDRWYAADSSFQMPAATGPDADQPSVRTSPTAEFPLDLSRFPQGLAALSLNVTLDDALSEESGGIIDPAKETKTLTLVHERAFEQATLVQDEDDAWTLYTVATGPVAADTRITLAPNGTLSTDVREELEDAGWSLSAGQATIELPRSTLIDGPSLGLASVTHGPPACMAYLQGSTAQTCWTGMELVVGFPVGELDPETIATVAADGTTLPLSIQSYLGEAAEPTVRHATEDTFDLASDDAEEGEPLTEVRGLPDEPTTTLATERVETLLEEVAEGFFAEITVQPDGPGAVATVPNPSENITETVPGHTHKTADHHRPHATAWQQPTPNGVDHDHPHVVVRTSGESPVALGGELSGPIGQADPDVKVLSCVVEPLTTVELRELIHADGRYDTCVITTEGADLSYLVPLGSAQTTRLISLSATTIGPQGETTSEAFDLHLDPVPGRGELSSVDPATSRIPRANVTLTIDAGSVPRDGADLSAHLTDDSTDITEIGLEVSLDGGPWTPVETDLSVPSERPLEATTEIDLTQALEENTTHAEIGLRGVITDESGNVVRTGESVFLFDRDVPQIKETVVERLETREQIVVKFDEDLNLVCGDDDDACTIEPLIDLPGLEKELKPQLDIEETAPGLQRVTVPATGLYHGIPYTLNLTVTDELGNQGQVSHVVETSSSLSLTAPALEDALLNKTVTLNWTVASTNQEAHDIRTSAYLLTPEDTCPLLVGLPGIATPGQGQTNEFGPLPLATDCDLGDEASSASLVMYTISSDLEIDAIELPVRLDAVGPNVTIEADEAWSNTPVEATVTASDALATDLEVRLDGEIAPGVGLNRTVRVSQPGLHTIEALATDEAGNTATATQTVRIDRQTPTLVANLLGTRGNLALVEVTGNDTLSGMDTLQVTTPSGQSGPEVPVKDGQTILLSTTVASSDKEITVRGTDLAGNLRSLRLTLTGAGQAPSTQVEDLSLATPGPDRLDLAFKTGKAAAPLVIIDAGEVHVERVLERGTTHQASFDSLAPGSQATVTIALQEGQTLVPVITRSIQMPQDTTPPPALRNVTAEPLKGAVKLTWAPPTDDIRPASVVIERDGEIIGHAKATSYLDERDDIQESTYRLAAEDAAGNRGPWTTVQATPDPDIRIINLTTTPSQATPDQPITVMATLSVPDGVAPDVVTLSTWESEVTMDRVAVGDGTATYAVNLRLPALNVTVGDPSLTIQAMAAGTTVERAFPAPVVSAVPATELDPSSADTPMPGPLMLLATLGLSAAFLRRRWTP